MKVIYKNRLPHIAPVGATFFVTFRLGDSLPLKIITALKDQLEEAIKHIKAGKSRGDIQKIRKQYSVFFKKYDQQLDQYPHGKCYLKIPEIAEIVQSKLHSMDRDLYDLIAYTIMPNHVHILIDTLIQLIDDQGLILDEVPENYNQLDNIMRLIKGSTAFDSNKALKREGTFWQKDSFDHFVRNEDELNNIIEYILQNPVKAGLVENWEDYPYNYVKDIEEK